MNIPEHELIILKYGIKYDKNMGDWVTIEATKFDEEFSKPISWAIRCGGRCMSKITKSFDYEPLPSSRDDEFFDEYRFNTPEEAYKSYFIQI